MLHNNWKPFLYSIILAFGVLIGMLLSPSSPTGIRGGDKWSELLRLIDQVYVDSVDVSTLEESAIKELLTHLDPHSVYIAASDMQLANEQLEGNFEGIGVEFNILNDTIMVITPIEGGPSKELGIQAGDRIIKVNQETVAGVGIDNDKVFKLLRGPKGSKVNVTIFRPDIVDTINYQIKRGTIAVKSVDASLFINEQTGYIKVTRFAAETATEFSKALKALAGTGKLTNLIIDLRGNPGGYLSAVIDMADQLLDGDKLIVYTEGRNQPRADFKAEKTGVFETGKIVVLIDEGSASASEILAGAIQDHDRGLVIGRRSFGKGLVQEQFQLKDGSGLRLTVSRYYTPSGRCIQKPYADGYEAYEHELLERFENGEVENNTPSTQTDTTKYYTSKKRVVFAGGGISPDIFVPIDTSYRCDYMTEILSQQLLSNFATWYTDKNRKSLNQFASAEAFVTNFNSPLAEPFVSYAQGRGIRKPTPAEWNKVRTFINRQLKALIARQLWRDNGYYQVQSNHDLTIIKAVEALKNYNEYLK